MNSFCTLSSEIIISKTVIDKRVKICVLDNFESYKNKYFILLKVTNDCSLEQLYIWKLNDGAYHPFDVEMCHHLDSQIFNHLNWHCSYEVKKNTSFVWHVRTIQYYPYCFERFQKIEGKVATDFFKSHLSFNHTVPYGTSTVVRGRAGTNGKYNFVSTLAQWWMKNEIKTKSNKRY